ncbi:hypothetical protein D7W79_01715 [Corallococcus exercitus]|uniref:transposase n=1 Tax=Corallococcus exercitus TaxID=2316736 RepID=UPI000EA33FC5|nr:hypothetical protein D7W79_01715 [Corallococcus exercitus]
MHEKLVLADSGYGSCREFRRAFRARRLHFLVGVQGNLNVCLRRPCRCFLNECRTQ